MTIKVIIDMVILFVFLLHADMFQGVLFLGHDMKLQNFSFSQLILMMQF